MTPISVSGLIRFLVREINHAHEWLHANNHYSGVTVKTGIEANIRRLESGYASLLVVIDGGEFDAMYPSGLLFTWAMLVESTLIELKQAWVEIEV